jgi:hypothetical protein
MYTDNASERLLQFCAGAFIIEKIQGMFNGDLKSRDSLFYVQKPQVFAHKKVKPLLPAYIFWMRANTSLCV